MVYVKWSPTLPACLPTLPAYLPQSGSTPQFAVERPLCVRVCFGMGILFFFGTNAIRFKGKTFEKLADQKKATM